MERLAITGINPLTGQREIITPLCGVETIRTVYAKLLRSGSIYSAIKIQRVSNIKQLELW